jgi:hypothetical protein
MSRHDGNAAMPVLIVCPVAQSVHPDARQVEAAAGCNKGMARLVTRYLLAPGQCLERNNL